MTTQRLEPAAIDPEFVPRFREPVVLVPVQDEAVLYEQDTGRIHQLDPIGTMVSGCFDGASSIAAIVDDLAEAFAADRVVIEADVLEFARRVGRLGVLEGVEGDFYRDEDAALER